MIRFVKIFILTSAAGAWAGPPPAVTKPVAVPISKTAPAPVTKHSPKLAVHLTPSGEITPAQFRGKVVVLAFLLTDCPHCQAAVKILSDLQKAYGDKGLQIVGAAFNEKAAELVPPFARDYKPAFPLGYVTRTDVVNYLNGAEIAELWVPVIVFIDRKGVFRNQYLGDDIFHKFFEHNVRQKIENLLAEPVSGGAKLTPPKKTAPAGK